MTGIDVSLEMFQDKKKKCVICKHNVRDDNENIMQRDAADFQLIHAHVDTISSNKVCVHIFNKLSRRDKNNDLQHAW